MAMLSLDKFTIEHIAKCIFPVLINGELREEETTYERMRDLVMLARTCSYLHEIIAPMIGEYARRSSTRIEDEDKVKYVDLCERPHNYMGPAIIWSNITVYLIDGKEHRVSGPAIEREDGHREWWRYGKPHRIGGPAVEHVDGMREWFQNGMRHREDGPATEHADGSYEW